MRSLKIFSLSFCMALLAGGVFLIIRNRQANPTPAVDNTEQTALVIQPPVTLLPTSTSSYMPASQQKINLGILGDSNSDEYRADDNRGGDYAATTLNWAEQLVLYRGLNVGPCGTRNTPRRGGFEYNWALSGETTESMITSGQHTGLAQQIAAGQVNYAIIYIGTNDFSIPSGAYDEIYSGALTGDTLQTKINSIIYSIDVAANTILQTGTVNLVIATYADPNLVPGIETLYPDEVGREQVSGAINQVNQAILAIAAAHSNVVVADMRAFSINTLSHMDSSGLLDVGGELISLAEKGDEPNHFFLGDTYGHPGTVISGLLANTFIAALNEFGSNIAPFTEAELLANASINPPPEPAIIRFESTETTLSAGEPVTLTWQTQGIYCASISNEIDTISVPPNGQMIFTPTRPTIYSFGATNTSGQTIYEQQIIQ